MDLLLILFLYNLNEEVEEDSDKETDANNANVKKMEEAMVNNLKIIVKIDI